jgi:hypothetical protein
LILFDNPGLMVELSLRDERRVDTRSDGIVAGTLINTFADERGPYFFILLNIYTSPSSVFLVLGVRMTLNGGI